MYATLVIVLYLSIVDNVSAQTSCVISPDLDMLTIRDPLGRNIDLHCQCIDDNGIITGTRWFFSNMSIVSTDNSNRPYSTGTTPSRLFIASQFTSADMGTYTCSPNSTFPTIPPGDSITLNAAGKYYKMYKLLFSGRSYTKSPSLASITLLCALYHFCKVLCVVGLCNNSDNATSVLISCYQYWLHHLSIIVNNCIAQYISALGDV